jgi:tetrahydromethanopterin S-methyltransferase subunit G
MAVDDDRRSRSFARLAEVIGRDEAVTIFEMLPPQGTDLATRADLGTLDRRFEQVDRRFEQVDQRFERIDHRLDRIETALHDLRGEVLTAVAGQTRSLVLGVLTATVSIGGLSALLAQL